MNKINLQEIEYFKGEIERMAEYDSFHANNPESQIESLSVMVGDLLANNKNHENDRLIALFYHIGKSLKELIKYRTINKQNNGEH